MVSRAAKVNCTDVLIVLWAWHLVATPGRAKQAKVKSASLVKALLTTHPQGESWGSFLALSNPTSSPGCRLSFGSSPLCDHTGQHPPMQHSLVPPAPTPHAPTLAGWGRLTAFLPKYFGVPHSLCQKFGHFVDFSFSPSDRVQIFWGSGEGHHHPSIRDCQQEFQKGSFLKV